LLSEYSTDQSYIELQMIFQKLKDLQDIPVNISPFISIWKGWENKLINPCVQQDASEFFNALITYLSNNLQNLFFEKLVNIIEKEANKEKQFANFLFSPYL
jgi:hypothetical protein